MNTYEITFIIRPDMDEEATRGAIDAVNRRLEASGGEIIGPYMWMPPRRRLAFPIRDFGDGVYATTVFKIESDALREIENSLRLNENILRFLVVQASEGTIRRASQPTPQPVAAGVSASQSAPVQQGGSIAPPSASPTPPTAASTPEGVEALPQAVPVSDGSEPASPPTGTEPVPTDAVSQAAPASPSEASAPTTESTPAGTEPVTPGA